MHSSTQVTDEFYSVLSVAKLQNRTQNLGNEPEKAESQEDLFREFEAFQRWRKTKAVDIINL
jgi:hypothetical protein